MSAKDRGASASTYERRNRAAAAFYTLNPGVKKSLYSGAGGQENSAKVAGLLTKPCPCPPSSIVYTVTYNGNGNTGGSAPNDSASPYPAGATVTVLGAGSLTRTGFLFTGWNTVADGSGIGYNASSTFVVTSNVILYAQWSPSYTVTYDGNGNTGGTAPVDPSSYISGSSVTVLGAGSLTRTGFSFTGWNTSAGGSGTSYAAGSILTMAFNSVILYAQWSIIRYSVIYNGNGNTGGSAPNDSASPYPAGATVTVQSANSLTRTGFSFTGWNTVADGSGLAYSAGSRFTVTSNVILYAQWTALPTYSVTYNGNLNDGGSAPVDPSSPYLTGSLVTVLGPGSLTKTGYLFDGWNTVANGSGTPYAAGSSLTIVFSSVTLYAQWTPSYTVTYNGYLSDGGTVPVDPLSPYAAGSTVTVLDNTGGLYRFDTIFLGWYTEGYIGVTPEYVAGDTFVITSDTTLYPYWGV